MIIQEIPASDVQAIDRKFVIQTLLSQLKGGSYLEIGVELGQSLLPIQASQKQGVDPNPIVPVRDRLRMFMQNVFSRNKVHLHQMTSDDFFARRSSILGDSKIDVALVDGLHTYEQAYKDVLNCLEVLSPSGIIIMHDCNPPSARIALRAHSHSEALKQFPADGDFRWCGDVWKAIVLLRSLHTELQTFVLDTDFGLGIVSRGAATSKLPYSRKEIEAMSFEDLAARRATLLDLRPATSFNEFLANR